MYVCHVNTKRNKMKKHWKYLVGILALSSAAYIGYFTYDSMQVRTIENDLILTNVEALAGFESVTTWSCQGSQPEDNCSASCGVCGTRVPAKGYADGYLSGSHSCSFN